MQYDFVMTITANKHTTTLYILNEFIKQWFEHCSKMQVVIKVSSPPTARTQCR